MTSRICRSYWHVNCLWLNSTRYYGRGNARICASSEIIEYHLRSSVSFRELNKFVMKGNHCSPKCGSRKKTTTVVGSHWKVIRAIVENLPKDLHLYRNLVGTRYNDFRTFFRSSWLLKSVCLLTCNDYYKITIYYQFIILSINLILL